MSSERLQQLLDQSAERAGDAMKSTFTRPERRLDAEQFRDFWRSTRMFAVATNGVSGFPHIAPVHVLLTEDDSFEMAIFEDSVRLEDLRQDPSIAITTWSDDGRTAIVYGRATEVPETRHEVSPGGRGVRAVLTMRIEPLRIYAMDPRRT